MTLNITSLSQKHLADFPKETLRERQSLLFPGGTVYLYGDRTYTGKLIHPVERTYPPKWTVQLDRGGYEAVNVKDIDVFKSIREEKSTET